MNMTCVVDSVAKCGVVSLLIVDMLTERDFEFSMNLPCFLYGVIFILADWNNGGNPPLQGVMFQDKGDKSVN